LSIVFGGHFCRLDRNRKIPGTCADIEDGFAIGLGDFIRAYLYLKKLGWVEPAGEEEGSLLGRMPSARVERTAEGTTIVDSLSHRAFTVYLRKEKKLLMLPGAILFKRFTTTLLNAAASAVKTEIEVMFNRSAGKRNNHAPPAGSGLRIRTFQVHGGPRSSRCTK